MRENEDSDNDLPKDSYWQLRYQLKNLAEWRRDVNEDRKQLEERIRELEDWKLEQHTRLRDFIKWISILAGCIATAIELISRIVFK